MAITPAGQEELHFSLFSRVILKMANTKQDLT